MSRKVIGLKEIGLDLVDLGFDEEKQQYYAKTRFKCNDMDNPELLKARAVEMESKINCSIDVREDAVYLTNFYDIETFEYENEALIAAAKEGKCPERLDPRVVIREVDICMIEQEADSVALFMGTSQAERAEMSKNVISKFIGENESSKVN